MLTAYLAGPDLFLPDAEAHAAAKLEICARHGIRGLAPLNDEEAMLLPAAEAWRRIFAKDIAMMEASDIVIANLTPFRGPSADAGTLIEVGWFLGRGKPVFGYSNSAQDFAARALAQVAACPDPVPGLAVEGFGLADNLMIPGAVEDGGGLPIMLPPDKRDRPFASLEVFALCVAAAAARLAARSE